MENSPLHFRSVPKVLNISGASTNTIQTTFSSTSTPLSIKTDRSSILDSPCDGFALQASTFLKNTITSNLSVNSTPIHQSKTIPKKKSAPESYTCSFCNESLHLIFEGERIVDLTCGHSVHYECFSEMICPQDLFGNYNLKSNSHNDIVCPTCNLEVSCTDQSIITNLKSSQLLSKVDDVFKPISGNHNMSQIISTIENNKYTGTFDVHAEPKIYENTTLKLRNINENFEDDTDHNDTLHSQTISLIDDSSIYSSQNEDDPVTPQGQMGMNFWEQNDRIITPLSADTMNSSTRKQNASSFNTDLELAKVTFAPEFSTINKTEKEVEIGCVFNISATEFETSLETNKIEQIKNQIGKNKITDYIVGKIESSFSEVEFDFTSIGGLIIFDIMDITINQICFGKCQIFLFEYAIIVLDERSENLLLNQNLDSDIFISSIFEKNNSIMVNFNTIKLSNLTLTSENKILRHKWYVILTKLSKNYNLIDSIPLIQTSTNAWHLVNDTENSDIIPDDIKIVNALTSKGLDLPSKFLKRQILRPDPIPKTIILTLPLVNSEDYGLENNEYAEAIKKILNMVLDCISINTKLGVVFLGNHLKTVNSIGNYYGCIGKTWPGWKKVLDSITEDVVSFEDNEQQGSQWVHSWKYVDILAKLSFDDTRDNLDSLKQVICVSNELFLAHSVGSFEGTNFENPFFVTNKKRGFHLKERVTQLCKKYDAKLDYILLADEFRFEPKEILSLNQYLRGPIDASTCSTNEYNDAVTLDIALDFESLADTLESKIDNLNKVTIKEFDAEISFPTYVKLKNFESPCGKIEAKQLDSEHNNTYNISMKNIPSGLEKSLFFTMNVDTSDVSLSSQLKATLASSYVTIKANKLDTCLTVTLDVKLLTPDTFVARDTMTINLNINNDETDIFSFPQESDLSLPIVSKLSSVTDAYFIKRKIQMLVIQKLKEAVLAVPKFDQASKEKAILILNHLNLEIWELANSCNSSNTNNINENNIHKWAESLTDELNEIIDGYSLRNFQLSNMKCVNLFLKLS